MDQDLSEGDKNNRLHQKWYACSLKLLQKPPNRQEPLFLSQSNGGRLLNIAASILVPATGMLLGTGCVALVCCSNSMGF